jgi:hypothetical protein
MTQPDIGERIMPANYDNPIDTNYAHECAAYERGYRAAMAEKDAEIERLREACKAAENCIRHYHSEYQNQDAVLQQLQSAGEGEE